MRNKEISLENFLAVQEHLIRGFREYWSRERQLDPVGFPEKLPFPDWDEQLAMYMEDRLVEINGENEGVL